MSYTVTDDETAPSNTQSCLEHQYYVKKCHGRMKGLRGCPRHKLNEEGRE